MFEDNINTGLKVDESTSEDGLAKGILPRAGILGSTEPAFPGRSSELPKQSMCDLEEQKTGRCINNLRPQEQNSCMASSRLLLFLALPSVPESCDKLNHQNYSG